MSMNIEKLKRLAEAATPGPWWTSEESYPADHGPEYEVSTDGGRGIWIAKCQDKRINPYIALCSLENILALCELAEAALEKK